ncbi:MAG: hypothetical protein NC350_03720 [Corallococcus sp.]|nr:hypothetical protein [Corallococcus sp.]
MPTKKKTPDEKLSEKRIGCDKVATQKALCDLYKNVTMSKNSIKSLLSHTEAKESVQMMINQIDKYDEFCKKAESLADSIGVEVSPVSNSLLNMAKMGINMKMIGNDTEHNAIKILLNGTFMGIIDLYTLINHTEHLHSEVIMFAKEILAYQEDRTEKMKQML